MKKLVFFVFLFFSSFMVVGAKDNIITITEDKDDLYYESDVSTDYFFDEDGMIPGEAYQKELVISNQTEKDYSLFMKFVIDENQDNSMLDYLLLKIEDEQGNNLYEGKMRGFISNQDNDLEGIIPIGDYSSKEKKKLTFYIKLDSEYNNTNGAIQEVDWIFYAKGKDDEDVKTIIENPKTWASKVMNPASFILFILLLIGFILFARKAQMKEN